MKRVLIILGPTASGKSDLAVRVAKKLNGEIISADSRQVYKGLDIGTGKITREEMKGVSHHLLDVADPKKQFTVNDFVNKANKVITMIYHSAKLPIIVGGTGFYIDALTGRANFPNVPANPKLRAKLMKLPNAKLFSMLEKKDSRRATNIDANNKVRLVRALEIVEALGKVPPSPKSRRGLGEVYWIGLNPKDLNKRIEKRVKKMFKVGLLGEIKKLKKLGITNKRFKELGFEYWNPTEEKVIRETKKYVKRQMTWFKRNPKIAWHGDAKSAYANILKLLAKGKQSQSR